MMRREERRRCTCRSSVGYMLQTTPIIITFFSYYSFIYIYIYIYKTEKIENAEAPFTLVRFRFKTHNFCYSYAYCLHYSGVLHPRKRRLLKTPGLRFSVNGPKRRLSKTMAWQATFALRILDDRVNNNIMLIVVPIDCSKHVHLNENALV